MKAFEVTVTYGSGREEKYLVTCEYISTANSLISDELIYTYGWEITNIKDISKDYENVLFESSYRHE